MINKDWQWIGMNNNLESQRDGQKKKKQDKNSERERERWENLFSMLTMTMMEKVHCLKCQIHYVLN